MSIQKTPPSASESTAHAPQPPVATAQVAQRPTRSRLPRLLRLALVGLGLIPVVWFVGAWIAYPSDRTPEGAYLRVVAAVNRDRPEAFFPYIETQADHACFTIRDYRRQSRQLVLATYPEPERSRLAAEYETVALAKDGSDVFALMARGYGWVDRLRRDLTGIDHVEIEGDRATVVTRKGTRYPFRRRENGTWGLTLFTARLVGDAKKAARDHSLIEQAAADYERVRKRQE